MDYAATPIAAPGFVRFYFDSTGALSTFNLDANDVLRVNDYFYMGATQSGSVRLNLSGSAALILDGGNVFQIGGAASSAVFNQTSGTLTLGVTQAAPWTIAAKGTHDFSGGTINGNRGMTINAGGSYVQTGGAANFAADNSTSISGSFSLSGGTFRTREFSVNAGGAASWTGGTIAGQTGSRLQLLGAGASWTQAGGTLTLNGAGIAGASTLTLVQSSTLQGYGTIADARFGLSSLGTFQNSGRVIANGGGTDRSLNLSSFNPANLTNTTDNTSSNGWLATGQGRLVLPTLAIASTGTVNWGEAQADTTLDLVNSMRLTSAGVTSGSMSISLMATDRTDVATAMTALSTLGIPSANVFSLFKVDPLGGFAFGSGNLSLQVRYNDSNVAAGTAGALRLLRYNANGWTDISSSVDSANKTISSQSLTSFGTLSDGGVLMSVNYAPSAVYSLAATTSGSSIRVGSSATLTATIASGTAAVAPDTLGYTGLALTGAGGLSSTSGTLAPGASGSGTVTYTGTAGGQFTFNPTVTSATNVNLGTSATSGSTSGVTVNVYNPAAANTLSTPINLGTVLKGTSLSQALSITNTAPNGGFSEKLDATFGTLTGGATTNSGSISLLAAGGTSTAMTVGLGSATAGAKSGSVGLNFVSNGAGTSGLAPLNLDPQTVSLTATVLDPAVASFTSGSTTSTSLTLDFLTVNEGSTVSPLGFNFYNLMQTVGYTADLALVSISQTNPTGPLSTNLELFNTLASGSFNSWQAFVNTSNQGTFSNTWTLQFKSSNGGTVYTGDTPQTLTLTANVIVVPEPGAIALAGIGIAAAAYSLLRRRTGC